MSWKIISYVAASSPISKPTVAPTISDEFSNLIQFVLRVGVHFESLLLISIIIIWHHIGETFMQMPINMSKMFPAPEVFISEIHSKIDGCLAGTNYCFQFRSNYKGLFSVNLCYNLFAEKKYFNLYVRINYIGRLYFLVKYKNAHYILLLIIYFHFRYCNE